MCDQHGAMQCSAVAVCERTTMLPELSPLMNLRWRSSKTMQVISDWCECLYRRTTRPVMPLQT